MKRAYWLILITYIVMQLSSIIGVPLLVKLFVETGNEKTALADATAYWILTSFLAGLFVTLWLLRNEFRLEKLDRNKPPLTEAILWTMAGPFLAIAGQILGVQIESMLGIKAGSENTEFILTFIEAYSFIIIATSILGPILEEIVFRKVIFGSIYKRTNFWIAGLISSVLFALVHFDFTHIILYTLTGFTFAFLYVKTKRIWVPIVAHVAINTFVVVIQGLYGEHMTVAYWILGGTL